MPYERNKTLGVISTRREPVEVMADIFEAANYGQGELTLRAGLGWNQTIRFLPFLLDRGFLTREDGVYHVTAKGQQLHHAIDRVLRRLAGTYPGRDREVADMRANGATFSQIGSHLGLSRNRAYQIAKKYEYRGGPAEVKP